ncbi:MAG: TldD/PmbA family protein [Candidatus Omnitrophica bacterium]|nr:TldD/PmbA family protein [Candidatus Omnitrophota bacterium]MBU1889515.1 TldD/PmbA family protein [Candidatus Omnitrophota bacterium]
MEYDKTCPNLSGSNKIIMFTKQTLLELCASVGADFTEVRIVESFNAAIQIQDGKALKLSSSNSIGAGIRVLKDGSWGFVSCENILNKDSLYSAIKNALALAVSSDRKWTEKREIAKVEPIQAIISSKVKIDPRNVPFKTKMEKLSQLEASARKYSPSVVNTVLNYGDSYIKETISNSSGTYIQQEKILTRASLTVTAYKDGVRQSSHKSAAGVKGFEIIEELTPENFSHKVASKTVELLAAENPPSGRFPVILAPSMVGLFTHEAVGHNAEADAVKSSSSIFEGKIGSQIASSVVSMVDDPTFENAYGSYVYDSEGTKAKKTIIIENGVLKNFINNLETARFFNVSPTGNARADGYSSSPIVRMSNTYMLPGKSSFDDILAGTKKGIFVEDVGFGGYVFPERGQFMFNANSSYLIENGKKTKLLKNVSLTGLTLETLLNVEQVSKEFSLSGEGGTCGKSGQGAPVDDGGPYIKVKEMLVGGR